MGKRTPWKLLLAILSLVLSALLTLVSWRIAAEFHFRTPGDWASAYIARYVGFGGNQWDIGAPIRAAFWIDSTLWLLLLWSGYFSIRKLRTDRRKEH